jgi:hypothetical protein
MKILKVLLLAVLITAMAQPVNACEEGCTPGYWKNHPDSWVCFSPCDSFGDVFGVVIEVRAGGKDTICNPTLMEALNANGGGVNALARHAVAALLNASHPDIDYPMSEGCVIGTVNGAIACDDKDVIECIKNILDHWNNLGCP